MSKGINIMNLNELSEIIVHASITLYDITESDMQLTAELKDGRTIKIKIMEVDDEE